MRARIAAAAARIMAEDGIDNFALAKRKAARQLGAAGHRGAARQRRDRSRRCTRTAPCTRPTSIRSASPSCAQSRCEAMQALEQFSPYLTGPVLKGTAGPYAEIELQLFPESAKEVEIFLLDRSIPYDDRRRPALTRATGCTPSACFRLTWQDAPLKLSVFDPRDERVALKTSQAGRVLERAGIAEVERPAARW